MPVETATLTLFLATVCVFILTPGPNMIFCVSRAVIGGSSVGVYSALGVCIGLAIHATAAGLGLSQLFKYFPVAYDVLKVGGAAYLLWLAWQSYASSRNAALDFSEASVPLKGAHPRVLRIIAQGTLNALLSPKAVFFYLVLFPQFLDPARGRILTQSLFLIMVVNLLNFTVIASLCVGAGRSSRWLAKNPMVIAWQRKLVAVVFVGLAARVALTKSPA